MKLLKKLLLFTICLILLIMPGCSLFIPTTGGSATEGGEGDGGDHGGGDVGGGDGGDPPPVTYYTVSFYNDDNTFLWAGQFAENTLIPEIQYNGPAFSKSSSATEEYEFMFWENRDSHDVYVTRDVSLHAYYASKTRHYDVTYKNYDGSVLEEVKTQYGEESVYSGFKPKRKSDDKAYTFIGWDNSNNVITANTEYVAQYLETDLYGVEINKERYSEYTGNYHPDTGSSVNYSSSVGVYNFTNNNVISYLNEGEYLRFYSENSISNKTAIKGIENVCFEGIKGSISVSFGWLNKKGEVEYLITEIANAQTPTVWAPYPATHVSMKANLKENELASASSVTIRYSNVAPKYNPIEYTEDLTFELLDNGTYEASLLEIPTKDGTTLSDDTEVIIPAFYNGKPVTQVGKVIGEFKTVYIPDNVKRFTWDLIDSNNLKEIRIPNTIEEILYTSYNYEFYNYINNSTNVKRYKGYNYVGNEENPYLVVLGHHENYLGYFHIASSCRVVAQKAFCRQYEGNQFESIEIPSSVISIGRDAFVQMEYIVILEDSQLKYIGAGAFYEAHIYDFVMPKNVEVISAAAFYDAEIENITFSEDSKLRVIERGAFNRTSFESIDLPIGLEEIGDYAFAETPLKKIEIPSTVHTIGNAILCDNYPLNEIILKGGNANFEVIDGNLYTKDGTKLLAYTNVDKKAIMEIPSHVTEIPERTFEGEFTIKVLFVGENVKTVGDDAFYDTQMTVYYAGETKPIGWQDMVNRTDGNYKLFLGVTKDDVITINGMQYIIEDNSATLTRFVTYPLEGGNVEIPSKITVGTIEYNVETLAEYAFYNAYFDNCGTLTIPNTVKTIKKECFYGSMFTDINIPENVEIIEENAYAYTNQPNIYLPKTIKSFAGLFGPGWNTPTKFYYQGTVEDWVENVENSTIRYDDLYFKYGDNYVHKNDVQEVYYINRTTLPTSILLCFQNRSGPIKVYIGKEVTSFEGTWDFWKNDGVNVHIYYEGTEDELKAINGESVIDGTFFTINYNVDFTEIRKS